MLRRVWYLRRVVVGQHFLSIFFSVCVGWLLCTNVLCCCYCCCLIILETENISVFENYLNFKKHVKIRRLGINKIYFFSYVFLYVLYGTKGWRTHCPVILLWHSSIFEDPMILLLSYIHVVRMNMSHRSHRSFYTIYISFKKSQESDTWVCPNLSFFRSRSRTNETDTRHTTQKGIIRSYQALQ